MSCYVNCYANSMTILIFSVPCGLIIIILIMSNTMMGLENARKIQPVHLDATRIKLIHLFFIRNLNFGWALMFLSHSLISVLEGSYGFLMIFVDCDILQFEYSTYRHTYVQHVLDYSLSFSLPKHCRLYINVSQLSIWDPLPARQWNAGQATGL